MDDGYEIDVKSGHLVISNVPYVNAEKQVRRGNACLHLGFGR